MPTQLGSHVRITINGELIHNGLLSEWTNIPPDAFTDRINPNATPQPWTKALMVTLADAILTGTDIDLNLTTTSHSWTLTARHD